MLVLRTAAIVHDIGIKNAEKKYGRCDGALQEQEGPAEAEKMLRELEYSDKVTEDVCSLIAHHHTYGGVTDIRLRILIEADFIVNAYEDGLKQESIICSRYKMFKTQSGTRLLNSIYGLN